MASSSPVPGLGIYKTLRQVCMSTEWAVADAKRRQGHQQKGTSLGLLEIEGGRTEAIAEIARMRDQAELIHQLLETN